MFYICGKKLKAPEAAAVETCTRVGSKEAIGTRARVLTAPRKPRRTLLAVTDINNSNC